MKNKILAIAFAAGVLFSFSGCSIAGSSNTQPAGAFLVSAVSANSRSMDVYINNSGLVHSISYGGYTQYIQVAPGAYTLQLVDSSATSAFLTMPLNIQSNTYYSVFAVDSSNTDTISKVQAVVVTDDLTAPPSDSAKVRFLDFSPADTTFDIALTGGPVITSGRTFNDQSSNTSLASFKSVTAGTYSFDIRIAGTFNLLLTVPNLKLTGGHIYTVLLRGIYGATDKRALTLSLLEHL